MPVLITTQKAAQAAVRACRSFCYLCGNAFQPDDQTDGDHVPNKRLFLAEDRENFSLVLDTHVSCNNGHSTDDNTITQLIGVIHRTNIDDHKGGRLRVKVGRLEDGRLAIAAFDLPIRQVIRRWVQGFHAALYGEFLSPKTHSEYSRITVHPPLAQGLDKEGVWTPVPTPEQVPIIVEAVKWNRAAGTTDKVVSQRGQCHYECTWVTLSNGDYACFFALQLYDWKTLGDARQGQRGCVGFYYFDDGRKPDTATLGSKSPHSVSSGDALDPFS